MAQSDAAAAGVPLYAAEQLLATEEALGLVSDLQRDWWPGVGIAMDPTVYGYPLELKGTPECTLIPMCSKSNPSFQSSGPFVP